LHEYIIISLTATIGSIGAAGVPSVALVMMTIVFTSVGIPIEAIAIIAGIDRLLDMFRTAINVTGDLTISKVVDSINNG
jgi:Na+/H+-dicarboxylate symporter